jgi:predicted SnoaL-like aldol condensation-catalyzing enzyme
MNHLKFVSAAAIGLFGVAAPFMVAQAATYTAEEKTDTKVVADFYAALDARDAAGGESKMPIRPILEKYIKEDYIQHMAGQEQGREGLAKMFTGRPGGPPGGGAAPNGAGGFPPGGAPPGSAGAPGGAGGPPGGASKVVFIGAVGNTVVRINQRTMPGINGQPPATMTIFNMFRVEDGKLAEHWDGSSGGGMGGPGGAGGPPRGGAGGPPAAGGPGGQ